MAGLETMPQTLNPYAYGVNGPLAYPDPSGEFIFAPLIAAGAAVGGVTGALVYAGTTNDFSLLGLAGATAGGAIAGGAGVATAAFGMGAIATVGVNLAAGAAGTAISDGLNPHESITLGRLTAGAAFNAGLGGLTGRMWRTTGMMPRSWRGVVPNWLGGRARINAMRSVYYPSAFSSSATVIGSRGWDLGKYYLNTAKFNPFSGSGW